MDKHKCVECGNTPASVRVCTGDGRVHQHGGVHTITGKLGLMCDECYARDKQAWAAKKGPEHAFG